MGFSVISRFWRSIRRCVRHYHKGLWASGAAIVIVFLWLVAVSVSPSDFPRNAIIRIDKDMTVSNAAELLKSKNIIKSAFIYKAYVVLLHDGKGIQAGSYLFDEPQSALRVAYRTAYGIKNVEKIRLTIFEGTNIRDIAALLKKSIPNFDSAAFLAEAKQYEGYLYPETYFVDPDVTPDEIVTMMRDQFEIALEPLREAFATSTHSVEEIMTMASIIEKEANKYEDRRIISGILWKRIEKGMPLQVDVPFYYILNKNGNQPLTLKDLSTTSPYNTYKNKGLPPTPITNPGIKAIKAALFPAASPYYFYLADYDGVTHYAATHDGHVVNKQKYLQ